MPLLAQSRCFQHVSREAVARCPECERFYCRECVTEHEGRMVCRSCLSGIIDAGPKTSSTWLKDARAWLFSGFGYLIAVYVFYQIGRILLSIPSQFHSGGFLD